MHNIKDNTNGILIVVMGIDGAGKTTLINNIKRYGKNISRLKTMSIFDNSIFTKELEETAEMQHKTRREVYSSRLRSIVWRNDLINNTLTRVVLELEKGNVVILDRYCLCNKIYSSLEEQGLEHMDKLLDILPKPDLGIYLDVSVDEAVKRIKNRGKEIAPYETAEKLKRIREKYLRNLTQEKYPIVRVNGNLSEKEVTEETVEHIINLFNKKMSKGKDQKNSAREI